VVQGAGTNPLYEAFIEAGVQAGYPRTADTNGIQQEGFGRFDMNIDGGVRGSTAHAYLRIPRPNLTIRTGALVTRVVAEHGRAVAVEVASAGRVERIHAAREIVLAGGAFNTPQILLLSGIGPADALRRVGVAPVHDLPGVGRNLHDHVEVHIDQACPRPITLYGATKPWAKALIGARWMLRHDGPGATNHYEAGAFLRSEAGVRWPDIQIHFVPICYSSHHERRATEHGYRMHIGPLRQTSRGSVTLAAADPRMPPVIRLNALRTEADLRATRACFALGREIFAQAALAPFRGHERQPGPGARSAADLDAVMRATAVSAYHPCGTCRMGTDDMAVVDADARVRGIAALRVADASIIPQVTSGNLNAPVMMIGEKVAAMLKGEVPLRADLPVFEPAGWRDRQR
jgi:choline dehydrogenase